MNVQNFRYINLMFFLAFAATSIAFLKKLYLEKYMLQIIFTLLLHEYFIFENAKFQSALVWW